MTLHNQSESARTEGAIARLLRLAELALLTPELSPLARAELVDELEKERRELRSTPKTSRVALRRCDDRLVDISIHGVSLLHLERRGEGFSLQCHLEGEPAGSHVVLNVSCEGSRVYVDAVELPETSSGVAAGH